MNQIFEKRKRSLGEATEQIDGDRLRVSGKRTGRKYRDQITQRTATGSESRKRGIGERGKGAGNRDRHWRGGRRAGSVSERREGEEKAENKEHGEAVGNMEGKQAIVLELQGQLLVVPFHPTCCVPGNLVLLKTQHHPGIHRANTVTQITCYTDNFEGTHGTTLAPEQCVQIAP